MTWIRLATSMAGVAPLVLAMACGSGTTPDADAGPIGRPDAAGNSDGSNRDAAPDGPIGDGSGAAVEAGHDSATADTGADGLADGAEDGAEIDATVIDGAAGDAQISADAEAGLHPCGSPSVITLQGPDVDGGSIPLVDLGQTVIGALYHSGDCVLADSGGWILWDTPSGNQVARSGERRGARRESLCRRGEHVRTSCVSDGHLRGTIPRGVMRSSASRATAATHGQSRRRGLPYSRPPDRPSSHARGTTPRRRCSRLLRR